MNACLGEHANVQHFFDIELLSEIQLSLTEHADEHHKKPHQRGTCFLVFKVDDAALAFRCVSCLYSYQQHRQTVTDKNTLTSTIYKPHQRGTCFSRVQGQ